jgi:hypothetical protein
MKLDLSKLTEEDIIKLYDLSRHFNGPIYEDADPWGGSCKFDEEKIMNFVRNSRILAKHIEKLVDKIEKRVVRKDIITAQEAREYGEKNIEIEIKSNELPEQVIKTLMKRIQKVISSKPPDGDQYIFTEGIDDYGNEVRGISNYLSKPVIEQIITYFTDLGYNVKPAREHFQDSLKNIYRIDWIEQDKPQLPPPVYQREDAQPKEIK